METWSSRRSVEHARSDDFGYAHDGAVLFGHMHLTEDEIANLADATERAYTRIDQLLRSLGYPCCLRMWNFLARINQGDDDDERYRQFNLGRFQALARTPGFEKHLPASTTIGTHGGGLTIHVLAARTPGEQVENPRQVSAFRYPRAYGPKSPSFARAILKHWADRMQLFVSGTASVVGHESLHAGNPLAQLDETHRNFDSLLRRAGHLRRASFTKRAFRTDGLRLYIRHREQLPQVLARQRELFGAEVPLLCLQGDICRRDLLVEIEGRFTMTQCNPAPSASA